MRQDAVLLPFTAVALIVVTPLLTAVTKPELLSTVATSGLVEVYSIVSVFSFIAGSVISSPARAIDVFLSV